MARSRLTSIGSANLSAPKRKSRPSRGGFFVPVFPGRQIVLRAPVFPAPARANAALDEVPPGHGTAVATIPWSEASAAAACRDRRHQLANHQQSSEGFPEGLQPLSTRVCGISRCLGGVSNLNFYEPAPALDLRFSHPIRARWREAFPSGVRLHKPPGAVSRAAMPVASSDRQCKAWPAALAK